MEKRTDYVVGEEKISKSVRASMMGEKACSTVILRCNFSEWKFERFLRKFCTSKTYDLFRKTKVARSEVQPEPPR